MRSSTQNNVEFICSSHTYDSYYYACPHLLSPSEKKMFISYHEETFTLTDIKFFARFT